MNQRRHHIQLLVLTAIVFGSCEWHVAALANGKEFDTDVRPFLARYCFECHGKDAQEGDLRLDVLPAEFSASTLESPWLKVFEKLRSGEMPPKDEPRPDRQATEQVVKWIEHRLTLASAVRQLEEGRVMLRRLNRVEYENTIHDLMNIEVDLKDLLPEDNVAHGFDNIGEALNVSSVLMERYLEAADAALDAAIVKGERPETKKQRYSYLDERRIVENKNIFKPVEDGVAFFSSGYSPTMLGQFRAPVEGWYRFRFSAYAYQTNEKVSCKVYAGNVIGRDGFTHLVDYWDVNAKPTVIEFTDRLLRGDSIRLVPHGTGTSRDGKSIYQFNGAQNYKEAGMVAQWVEVEGPIIEHWPPKSRQRVFGDIPIELTNAEEIKRNRRIPPDYQFVSRNAAEDSKTLLTEFVRRAFRRAIDDADVQPYLELVKSRLDDGYSFEQAMRVGYKAVLCAPDFLFLVERGARRTLSAFREFTDQRGRKIVCRIVKHAGDQVVIERNDGQQFTVDVSTFSEKDQRTIRAGSSSGESSTERRPLNDFELANRLSYFLWSTMPDEPLIEAAANRKLHEPAMLRDQVERMLKDSRAASFTKNFVGQWLDLREIEFTTPDAQLYPEFDELLQISMVKETELFFEDILKNDLSLLNFVDSDFSILNQRLAEHYEIDGVDGQEFRKVQFPSGSHRGGVLTQASVLKVTANGTNTSPVIRGAWVLEKIIGQPAPPPPSNVPAVEPDIRGATTIRQQLAKHREISMCATCHKKMDPPGFALENFDVIGGWRDFYRSIGEGGRVDKVVNFRGVRYKQGPDVDSQDVLADGRRFDGIDEFKKLLLTDKDQIARCLTEKLLTYSTGGGIEFADRQEVEAIVARVAKNDYDFRSLVHEVVQSQVFLSK